MKTTGDGQKVFFIVFVFVGLFMIFPMAFIFLADGFTGFWLMPIIMFIIMLGASLFIFGAVKKSTKQYKQHTFQTDERHCIHCHESIETHHKYCPHCGVEQTDYIICDYCGHKNNKHNLQCEECNALIK